MPPVVLAENLSKSYRVGVKDPGALGTLKHFVRRRYRTVEAVKNVTFAVGEGEIVGFLGPNGAGKTTALKMLTGLIHPTSGVVRVAGHVPFKREKDFLARITLVMGQKQQLLWDLPALDSLRVNAATYEIDDGELKARVAELSEMLELGDKLNQPVRKLSLGERMKCELLAALLHRPKVLFLDEPTLGLDVNAQSAIRSFLKAYNERYGASILLTSHYMADITALAKRVMLIHQGSLIYDGDLDALLTRIAPNREVKVDLRQEARAEDMARFSHDVTIDGHEVRFSVPRDELTRTVNRVLSELDVVDLSITDPPVEELIGRAFKEGVAQ